MVKVARNSEFLTWREGGKPRSTNKCSTLDETKPVHHTLPMGRVGGIFVAVVLFFFLLQHDSNANGRVDTFALFFLLLTCCFISSCVTDWFT